MSNPQFYVYRVWGEQGSRLNLSPKPALDLEFYAKYYGFNQLEILSPKLPIAVAWNTLDSVAGSKSGYVVGSKSGHSGPSGIWPNQATFGYKVGTCLTLANQPTEIAGNPQPDSFPGYGDPALRRVCELLAGRILLWEEIKTKVHYQDRPSAAAYMDPMFSPVSPVSSISNRWPLLDLIQVLYLLGSAQILPGISANVNNKSICNRCGQSKSIVRASCPDCGKRCFQCEECLSMGAARTCTPLWAFSGDYLQLDQRAEPFDPAEAYRSKSEITVPRPGALIRAQLDFPLTPAQRDAAGQVLEKVVSGQGSRILVWAACGAGKTEVSFGAIAYTLRQGGKVLFAIPRRDVVKELEPRLKKAFPDTKIISLYGGSADQFSEGDLVLATTHQVIRYYRNFDLVVLDEADAFPYRGSTMLHFALQRARKPGGKLILMTATPEDRLLKGAVLVKIPARHHGFPLPEPEIVVDKKLQAPPTGAIAFPEKVLQLICSSVVTNGCQLFLFVPRVVLARRVAEYLRKALAAGAYRQDRFGQDWGFNWEEAIHYVHAGDPDRDQKIQAFKAKKFPLLVSTSIMERGITVSGCNVLVLMANQDRIFDAGTLVQMAGRAGRTADYPQGKVWFVGNGISPAMQAAVQGIRGMNAEARSRGYLISSES